MGGKEFFDGEGKKGVPRLADKLAEVARREIGVEEVDGSNCGPRVNEYKGATWLPADKGWPWCGAFVCWCVREAMREAGVRETGTFKRPRTAGAWDFENWSRQQDGSTQTRKPHGGDIRAGDLVIFTFSHIGIALGGPDEEGHVETVEGNTDAGGSREGGGVFRKRRRLGQIRSRVRFMV